MSRSAKIKNKRKSSLKSDSGKMARATDRPEPKPPAANRMFIGLLLLITLVLFGDILFGDGRRILSKEGTDIASEFYSSRSFGFSRMKQGDLPLWNPHLFSGMPYMGDFQTALLYPFNWHYLFMPVPRAINWGIAMHVLLGGIFMYAWTRNRGIHPAACFTSALMFMFCGPYFMHTFAGHLSNLCAMVWTPLIFLSLDRLADRFEWKGVLIGIAAVAMQILAGHPQYVFYTGVAAGFYTLLIAISQKRPGILARIAIIYLGGSALSAIQLLTGLLAGMESIRSVALPFEFVSMFSFPPENLLTLIIPGFFGNMPTMDYWGRWYLWEMSVFIGVAGAFMAGYGWFRGDKNVRCFAATMSVVFFIVALGHYTPLLKILYHTLPGFDAFRGNSKFMFIVCLFLIMSAAVGFDRLLKTGTPSWNMIAGIAVVSLIGGTIALMPRFVETPALWRRILTAASATGESYLSPGIYADPAFIRSSRLTASAGLGIAAVTGLLLAGALSAARFRRWGRYLPAVLIAGEMIFFAARMRVDFDASTLNIPGREDLRASSFGEDRVLNLYLNNMVMDLNLHDIWGINPGIPRRYAEFIAYSQGQDPDAVTQNLRIQNDNPLLRLTRFRHVIENKDGRAATREISPVRMPRFLLVDRYRLGARDDIFKAMAAVDFDPRHMVFLESHPDPAPSGTPAKGDVRLIRETTDSMEIQVELSAPAILVVTDSYSSGWKVKALGKNAGQSYTVMPANYTLRAVPLAAGSHHLLMEYRPLAFVVGKWISIVSLIAYLAVGVEVSRRSGWFRVND